MKLSSLGLVGALAVSAAGLVGCSEEPVESEAEASSAVIQGVIRIERTLTEDASTGATVGSISAKFLRAQQDDLERAERLVGTQLEIPSEGDCTPIADVRADGGDSRVRRSVELVDVGDLTLRAAQSDHTWQLTPRAFPDIGDLVSGVFYTQPDGAFDQGEDELPAPGRYTVNATGAAFVDAFSFDVDAPSVPSNVRVAGSPLAVPGSSAGRSTDRAPVVTVGQDVGVEWDAPSLKEGGSVDDGLVYVDVRGARAWRCTFRDTGAAILPSDVLSRDDAQQFLTISVHRVRDERVEPSRADASTPLNPPRVRFDFARSGRVFAE